MDLWKLIDKRNKTLGPDVASAQDWTLQQLKRLLEKKQIYLDPSFQRPKCWDSMMKESYIFDLHSTGYVVELSFVEIEKCMDECLSRWGEDDDDYKYFKNLYEKGFKYLSLDGNNRTCSVGDFFQNKLALTGGEAGRTLKDPSGQIDDFFIEKGKKYNFEQLPKKWQSKFNLQKVPVRVVTAATVGDLHFTFVKLNNTDELNHQEIRNAVRSRVADEVRAMAQESLPDENGVEQSGKFWDDFKTFLPAKELNRRKADELYARLLLLTSLHGTGEGGKGFLTPPDLLHPKLDEMYCKDSLTTKDMNLCRDLCKVVMQMAKVTKGEGFNLTKKMIINQYLFLLALRDEGFGIDVNSSEFEAFTNELDNHETKRMQEWYVIPPEEIEKRSTYSDKEWNTVKNTYSYDHWMNTANQSASNSLKNRFKATKKSVGILLEDPQFRTVFKVLPTSRKNISFKVKEMLATSQNWRCALTGKVFDKRQLRDAEVVADHWIPLNHGGSNDLSNIRIMFAGANARKSDDLLKEISYNKENEENEDLIEKLQNNKFAGLSDGFTAIIAAAQESEEVEAFLVPNDKAGKYLNIIHSISI